ncbi:nucleoside hydrolase [Luteolibacter marinus]|uniref:nucleoside hydrolase n=1 Tax=Luteolibacter marinus TaxID=2776705 RepID=UPI0018663EC1|nr:nucleoside hydrolase [Luteolibacter marinus]
MKTTSLLAALFAVSFAAADPVPVIFDTDMGNDVDDVMALAMLHSLESRGHCKLLAVTVTKDHALAAPFVDAVNTFYRRPDIPVGAVRDGATREEGKFNGLVNATDDGKPRYPHDLKGGDAPEAVGLLRKTLAGQEDGSVVMIQVGFFTNLARLLDSPPDGYSPLNGEDLVRKKVKLLSLMAGAFQPIHGNARYGEYNIVQDLPAARALADRWPTPCVWSGFEIGIAATYPHQSIERDYEYTPHHPLKEAYYLYEPPPHDRPTWDPTSVLHAVLPDHGYFELSEPGHVEVDEKGATHFKADAGGKHRYLILPPAGQGRVKEAITRLSSEPPR